MEKIFLAVIFSGVPVLVRKRISFIIIEERPIHYIKSVLSVLLADGVVGASSFFADTRKSATIGGNRNCSMLTKVDAHNKKHNKLRGFSRMVPLAALRKKQLFYFQSILIFVK